MKYLPATLGIVVIIVLVAAIAWVALQPQDRSLIDAINTLQP